MDEVEEEEEEEVGSNNNSNHSLIPEQEEEVMEEIDTHHSSNNISTNTSNISVAHQIKVDNHGQETTMVVVVGKDRERILVIQDKIQGAADGNLIKIDKYYFATIAYIKELFLYNFHAVYNIAWSNQNSQACAQILKNQLYKSSKIACVRILSL